MAFEVAIAGSEAKVRAVHLQRDLARGVEGTPIFLVVHPLSPPRLWGRVGDAVAAGFEKSVAGKPATPETIRAGLEGAIEAITKLRTQLIEPALTLDARLGAVMPVSGALHVALTAGVRLYRSRSGVPERLYSKSPRPEGIAKGHLFAASEATNPGDLFVLGTRDAFTVRSIGNLAAALARTNRAPAHELCEAVVGPCREGGIGAAAVVLRL